MFRELKLKKWEKENLKTPEEKQRNLKIHKKETKKYRGIKYLLYVMENHEGSKWVALESDLTQFQDWELKLFNTLKNNFDLMDSFLYYDSMDYQDHKSIEGQKRFLDGIVREQIDFLYSLCTKGHELVNEKIEYFNQVLKWMEKFNINRGNE